MGGLSGKAFQIEKAKTKSGLPHLLADSGNLLFKPRNTLPKTAAEMLTATTIRQAYSMMGYDAVAVSSSDLTAGEIFFKNSKKTNFPWVSSNVFDASGNLLFEPFITRKVGKIRVGVIGLTGPGNYENDKIVISGWEEPLRRQLAGLKSKVDMLILLSNFPSSENDTIAKEFPELDVIFAADKRQGNRPPHLAGDALITQTQSRGKYLGKLSMQYNPERKWSGDAQQTNPIANVFEADFVAIRPSAPQSEEINLLVKDLKKKIHLLNKQ